VAPSGQGRGRRAKDPRGMGNLQRRIAGEEPPRSPEPLSPHRTVFSSACFRGASGGPLR
jgi:hypothetical protein